MMNHVVQSIGPSRAAGLTQRFEEIAPPILRVTDLPRGAITRDNACAC